MLRNNKYYYEDKYMYFTFNNIHSSKYNLFMKNSGSDLKFINNANSSSQFINPQYQNRAYYSGTNSPQKTFPLDVAAEGLTLHQYKEMMLWLKAGELGFLVFDSNPYWGWDVVLDKADDATYYEKSDGTLIVEFKVTFKTVGTTLARSVWPSYFRVNSENASNKYTLIDSSCGNEYGVPEIVPFSNVKFTLTKKTLIFFDKLDTVKDYFQDWSKYNGYDIYTLTNSTYKFNWCYDGANLAGITDTTVTANKLTTTERGLEFKLTDCGLKIEASSTNQIVVNIFAQEDINITKYVEIQEAVQGTPLDENKSRDTVNEDSIITLYTYTTPADGQTPTDTTDYIVFEDSSEWYTPGIKYYLPCVSNELSYFTYTSTAKHEIFNLEVNNNPMLSYVFNKSDDNWTLSYNNDNGATLYNFTDFVENSEIIKDSKVDELTIQSNQNELPKIKNYSPIVIQPTKIKSVVDDDTKLTVTFDLSKYTFNFSRDEDVYMCVSAKRKNNDTYNSQIEGDLTYDYYGYSQIDFYKGENLTGTHEYTLTNIDNIEINSIQLIIGKYNVLHIDNKLENPILSLTKYNNL